MAWRCHRELVHVMDASTGPLNGVAQSFGEAFTSLVGWALAWWVGGDDPDLAMLRANVMAIRPVTSWLAAVVLGCQWCWQQSW